MKCSQHKSLHDVEWKSFSTAQTKGLKIIVISLVLSFLTGRWYIREGWLKVVPHKGADAKNKMFFLFSDILLEAKRCSPLHPTNENKFVGQHAYPLQDCSVEKVFGHTRSQGGLLSVSFNSSTHSKVLSNEGWYGKIKNILCNRYRAIDICKQKNNGCKAILIQYLCPPV